MKKLTLLFLVLCSFLSSCGKTNAERDCSYFVCWENALEADQGYRCIHLPWCNPYYYTILYTKDGDFMEIDEFTKEVKWDGGSVGEITDTSYTPDLVSWEITTDEGICIVALYPETMTADILSVCPDIKTGNYKALTSQSSRL